MKAAKYLAYKLGLSKNIQLLPEHWAELPLKRLFRLEKREPLESDEIVTAFRDGTVTLRKNRREDGFTNALKEIGYQRIIRDDLVIHAMDAFAGAIGVSDSDGKSTPVYSACTATKDANPHFYAYYLRDLALHGFIESLAKGIRERSTDFRWSDASMVAVPVPPRSEQLAIANFLDLETAKIDALIAEQQRLIELLQEKRQAVISHAVTKGLNPNAPMKDSGVEWLGEVPEHWTAQKASWLFRAEKGKKAQELTQEYCGANEGPFPVFSGQTKDGGVMGAIDSYEFDVGETGAILCTTVGAKAMSVRRITGQFSLSQNCMVITSKTAEATPAFFEYGFQPLFKHERALIPDHMQPSFRMEDFNQFWVQVPPIDEQATIAKYLQEKNQSNSELATAISGGIGLLQERRSALISAAVTGQIDVRGNAEVEGIEQ